MSLGEENSMADQPVRVNRGPHPSIIVVARNFIPEQELQNLIQKNGLTAQQERVQRIQAVNFIQSARQALEVPAQTFATACVLYHRFRLLREEKDYIWQDVAIASLFLACKIEDTLKKSREILCAVQNLKKSIGSDGMTPDDSFFDGGQKLVHGFERLLLEQNSFDFRSRKPLSMILKIGKKFDLDSALVEDICWIVGLDMYRTYAPLKAGTYAMALACLEIGFLLSNQDWAALTAEKNVKQFHVQRAEIMEVMQDLCDLWSSHHKDTCVGETISLDNIISVRIKLNAEMQEQSMPRYLGYRDTPPKSTTTSPVQESPASTKDTPETPVSPADTRNMTVRYMLDPERAARERSSVGKFFNDEYEEYEEEVVIADPPPESRHPANNHSHRGHPNSRGFSHSHPHRNYPPREAFSYRGGRRV
ncbi:MAG: RNA polymerase II C-terminal domain kinase beta subunit [Vezdaea aestivalis]|nr:MAG: RNA polymerase II C-terminal domain kinase beta subunit [Vezdaea aestivalis]